jgi:hypothetical protein
MGRRILERDAVLQPLSRDHGVLLVLSQKLGKMAGAGPRKCAQLHEQIRNKLGPLVKSYICDEDAALSQLGINEVLWQKVSRDHKKIVQSLERLPNADDHLRLRTFFARLGSLIDSHIRWDEHVLFPYIQETSDSSTLSQVYKYTANLESKRKRPTQRLHRSTKADALS